jgi:protein associated with RNAse G/E
MMSSMNPMAVIKLDIQGHESWRYSGKLIEEQPHERIIEAFFDRNDTQVDRLVLRKGDRFVEYYFDNRWFNIYEIFDRDSEQRKGWYCNISFPAQFTGNAIIFQDLALDLIVYPDGSQTILDKEEFNELPLSEDLRKAALTGLDELRELFNQQAKEGDVLERLISFIDRG